MYEVTAFANISTPDLSFLAFVPRKYSGLLDKLRFSSRPRKKNVGGTNKQYIDIKIYVLNYSNVTTGNPSPLSDIIISKCNHYHNSTWQLLLSGLLTVLVLHCIAGLHAVCASGEAVAELLSIDIKPLLHITLLYKCKSERTKTGKLECNMTCIVNVRMRHRCSDRREQWKEKMRLTSNRMSITRQQWNPHFMSA